MKSRNNLVEFARFLFSLLVVGYHVQFSFSGNAVNFFENGALAVEFFFLISGYFLARSIEKISAQENYNVGLESLRFMKNKIKGILPVHIVAILAMIIVLLAFDIQNSGRLIVNGLPSVFLVQMAVVWNGSYQIALIVPEWYLSAMLITMLFMVPIALLLRKKIKGIFCTLVLVGILLVVVIVSGLATKWAFPENLVMDIRAWGEMCVGMFAYFLSTVLVKREFSKTPSAIFKTVEIICYVVPIILGFVPMNISLQPVCMAVTVVCIFVAISITFSGKGVKITNQKLNALFGYLGSISLAIYLFHPVFISILDYAYNGFANWAKYLIVIATSIVLAILYKLIATGCKKAVAVIKNHNKTIEA